MLSVLGKKEPGNLLAERDYCRVWELARLKFAVWTRAQVDRKKEERKKSVGQAREGRPSIG